MKKMKKRRFTAFLLTFILLTASLAACQLGKSTAQKESAASSEQFIPHKFCVDDAVVSGLRIGVTPGQVKAVLGEPEQEFTEDHPWYSQRIGMMYDGFDLDFYDIHSGNSLTLGTVHCITPDLIFVNGLHVGSTKEDVLATFTYEENPAPLFFASISGQQGDYIYGDTNSTWFYETKPTGVIQTAYTEPRDECFGNSYTMTYDYSEPLVWEKDMSNFHAPLYRMVFFLDGNTDTVTEISLFYNMIDETMS